MKRLLLALLLFPQAALWAQTLDECQRAAERNYPLIQQYDLVGKTTDLTVSNIRKGWLPQLSASAQATLQSDVTAFPDQIQAVYRQMGINMEGLKKDQYRVGIDVNQTVYDGGAIKSQQEIARRQGELQEAQTSVTLYAVRQRVNEMYFGLLLLDAQIEQNNSLLELLSANERRLSSMYQRGTAAESDYAVVRAERLLADQKAASLASQRATLARLLSLFCGIEVSEVSKPPLVEAIASDSQRPELQAIEAKILLVDAQEKALDSALKPRLSLFAQGYYGYPGYNLFEDMMHRNWSLNGMVGARISWNIGALYTRKNDRSRLQLQRDSYEVERDVFLFNNNLQQQQQQENARCYREMMASDEEIIALRTKVRKAAESKLAHGIIDANDLVKEINSENTARVQQSVHEIEMLKQLYDFKYTTNQ
ncbi:MAG: TolC family protein [Prevotella sp.]|nr:TolC family protein [Prevotella sp.]